MANHIICTNRTYRIPPPPEGFSGPGPGRGVVDFDNQLQDLPEVEFHGTWQGSKMRVTLEPRGARVVCGDMIAVGGKRVMASQYVGKVQRSGSELYCMVVPA